MNWIKISVVLYVLCVQCSAMSNSELEDFVEFLHKTSRLDQVLKSAEPDEDYDEEESISDHAWEESGKFEGDLILNDRQRRVIVEDVAEGLSRNGLKDTTKRWPNNEVIYYIQKEHFSQDQMQAIQDGIDDLAQASCLKFRPYQKGDRDAVVIQGSRRGCFSQVGYQGGYQVLNLNARHPPGRGCFRHGTVVHELLHTLGFFHMQSSSDRDDYVDIVWDNIVQAARNNFRKYNSFSVSDFGVGYDYDSVLHYSRRAFSTNGQDTIVPKQNGAQIGQRVGLSDKDTQKLNKMYCDGNEADEEASHKTENKKNTSKNKPFQGHGIGYHQGKAIVIKLLPAAETYQLSDKPIHTFDYFSKTPQAVPTSKTEELGRNLEHTLRPPEYLNTPFYKDTYQRVSPLNLYSNTEQGKIESHPNEESYNNKRHKFTEGGVALVTKEHELIPTQDKNYIYNTFEKLGKVIKGYEHPTYQSIRENDGYKDFYPHRRSDNINVEYEYKDSDEVSDPRLVQTNAKHAAKFIESLHSSATDRLHSEKGSKEENDDPTELSIDDEEMKTFRTSFLRKTYEPYKFIPSPKYVKPANLRQRHDYSSLYDQSVEEKNSEYPKEKYKVLGEEVPLYDSWFKNHQLKEKNNNDKTTETHNDKTIEADDDDDDSTPELLSDFEHTNTSNKAYTYVGFPVQLYSWYNHR